MVQHQAILRRKMLFVRLAVAEIAATLCGIAVALCMAWRGFGYWSLAGMAISRSTAHLLLTISLMPWRPSMPRRGSGSRSSLKFGGNILIFNILNAISRNADNALLGWYWGATALGYYNKAYSILMLPISNINAPIGSVALPALSRLRFQPDQFRMYFLTCLEVVIAIVLPVVVICAVFADDLVALVMGPQWTECAALFRLLSAATFLYAATNPISWLFVVLNRTSLLRNIGLITAPLNVLAFAVGLPFGAKGVASAYSIVSCIVVVPLTYVALSGTNIKCREVFGRFVKPLVACCVGAVAALGLVSKLPFGFGASPIASLCVGSFSLLIVYAGIMFFFFGWRSKMFALGDLLLKTPA